MVGSWSFGFVAAGLVLMASLGALQGAAASDAPPASTRLKFFLRYSGESEATCAADRLSLSAEDGADGHACGEVEVQEPCYKVCRPPSKGPGSLTFSAAQRFDHTVSVGYTGSGKIWLKAKVPDEVRMTASIVVGTAYCSGRTDFVALPMPEGWVALDFDCSFIRQGASSEEDKETDVRSTGSLALVTRIERRANYFVGFEGEHASWIEFGADPAVAAGNKTQEPLAEPQRETPGLGASLAAGAVVSLGAWLRRRRA